MAGRQQREAGANLARLRRAPAAGPLRFNALQRAVVGISHRMLTVTLRGTPQAFSDVVTWTLWRMRPATAPAPPR